MDHKLTLANDDDEIAARAAGGSSGQGVLLKALSSDPLAKAEIDAAIKQLRRTRTPVDHIHLSRYDGTNLVQWYGRYSNGYHYPLGRLMKIAPPEARPE